MRKRAKKIRYYIASRCELTKGVYSEENEQEYSKFIFYRKFLAAVSHYSNPIDAETRQWFKEITKRLLFKGVGVQIENQSFIIRKN